MSVAIDNKRLFKKLVVVAIAMFGFGFALVPFYKKICEVTGINNIQKADKVINTQVDTSRLITVELDANIRSGLPWQFKPQQRSVQIHPGQLITVLYEIANTSDQAVVGQAIPSYGPKVAAQYFKKLECFCFTQQQLKPRETRYMPVVFVIQPDLPKDINTITLSYTFFGIEGTNRRQSG